jgi:hypothetical protein
MQRDINKVAGSEPPRGYGDKIEIKKIEGKVDRRCNWNCV